MRLTATLGLACVVWAAPAVSSAADATPDPKSAQAAWTALLGVADAPLPRDSGCEGAYGQAGRARVRDLLAAHLAYMGTGQNVVAGRCADGQCEVALQRRNGEDVSSATLGFRLLRNGRADARSLRCVITP